MKKKGQGLSINYIVTIAIALVVLVVIVLFFTGAFKKIVPQTQGYVNIDANTKQIWRDACETVCQGRGKYCEIYYKVDSNDDGKINEVYVCDLKAEKTVEELLKKEKISATIKSLNIPCDIECS